MPISMGTATTDRVDMGNPASLVDPSVFTMILWARSDGTTNTRVLMQKGRVASGGKQLLIRSGVNLELNIDRSTTDLLYQSNSTPVVTGAIKCYAATFNPNNAANTLGKLYVGDLRTPMTECTYGTTTDGSGTYPTDNNAADPFRIGNTPASDSSLIGLVWVAAYIFNELTLAQLRDWQFNPRPDFYDTRGFWRPGTNGTGPVWDESGRGNHGTMTGAIPISLCLPRVDRSRVTQLDPVFSRRTSSPFGARIGARQVSR